MPNQNPVYDVPCPKCGAKVRYRCTQPGVLRKHRVVVKPHPERLAKLKEGNK